MEIEAFFNVPVVDIGKESYITREIHLQQSLKLANPLGLYLEFGVFEGKTIRFCANHFPDRHFFGFDSFEGLPEVWNMSHEKTVERERFKVENLPDVPKNVTLVKGFFDSTIQPFLESNSGEVSFVHIDCDLYSSTRTVLRELNSRLVPGTIIVFDELCDWRLVLKKFGDNRDPQTRYTKWKEGEWMALNEWMMFFGRKVEPISRTWAMAAAIRVVS